MFNKIKNYFEQIKLKNYAQAWESLNNWKRYKKSFLGSTSIRQVIANSKWYQGKIIDYNFTINYYRKEVKKYL